MIDFTLTEEQSALRETASKVAREVYARHIDEWDRERRPIPLEQRKRLGDLGFLGLALPAEYGGGGGDLLDALIVIEEMTKENLIVAFQIFEANTGPIRAVHLLGTREQKERFIPPVVAGESTMAVAISEPDAGSAATDLKTTARRSDSHYVVNGMKRWCTGAGHAERYLVYVRIGDRKGAGGVGAIVVDRDTPGLKFGPREQLHGLNGLPSADMHFDDVVVPAENLIVGEGGFPRLFGAFSIERLGNCAMCIGLGQACLDRTAAYVQERKQFGKPIIEFQAVQMMLADMVIQVEAARLLAWRAASKAKDRPPSALESSIAKCYANEMAKAVSDLAMQLHGGYGYHREYHVERNHRDAHGLAVGGGTPQIQRIRITSEYLNRKFNQRA